MKKAYYIIVMFLFCISGVQAQIVIDGDMSDWAAVRQFDVAPNNLEDVGDQALPELDIKDLYVTHDDNYLYFRIDLNENGAFSDLATDPGSGMKSTHEIFIDVDADNSTGLTWGWWAMGADYWILLNVPHGKGWVEPWMPDGTLGTHGIARFIGTGPTDSQWEDTQDSVLVAVNADDNIMELAVPRAAIGETNGEMETTRFMFYSENTSDWAAPEAYPNDVGSLSATYRYGTQPIAIDGDLSDWADVAQFDVAPNDLEDVGDQALPELDIKDLYVTHDDNYLYFRFDLNENGAFSDLATDPASGMKSTHEIFIDVDVCDTTGLTWGWWAMGADYWILLNVPHGKGWVEPWMPDGTLGTHGIARFVGTGPTDSQWEDTQDSVIIGINQDDNVMEFAVPRAVLGEKNGEVETTRFMFYSENTSDWAAPEGYPNDAGGLSAIYVYGNPTGVADQPAAKALPEDFTLSQNFPNPFNPATTIDYSISSGSHVVMEVFNILGEHITTLVDAQQSTGNYRVSWNGLNAAGYPVSAGVYIYTLKSQGTSIAKKMLYMK